MSRTSTLILLGILTILVPFSGLPIAFRSLLAVVFGACVAGIGLSMRMKEVNDSAPPTPPPPLEPSTPEPPPPPPPQGVSPI